MISLSLSGHGGCFWSCLVERFNLSSLMQSRYDSSVCLGCKIFPDISHLRSGLSSAIAFEAKERRKCWMITVESLEASNVSSPDSFVAFN